MKYKSKLIISWIVAIYRLENDANCFFDAIMELKYTSENRSDQTWGLGQVDNVLIRGEELRQRTGQFLECCLLSDSSDAKRHEFVSEIVAANSFSREKVEAKLVALCKKAEKLDTLAEKANSSEEQMSSGSMFTSGDIGLKDLKDIAAWLRCEIKFYRVARELVEEFWLYLPPNARAATEKLAYSLLGRRSDKAYTASIRGVVDLMKRLDVVFKHSLKKSLYKRVNTQELSLLFSRHDTEVVKFINSVFQRVDQVHPNKDWYEPLLMEKCLDSLMDDVGDDISKLVPYTKEMDDELEVLLDGVEVD